MTQLDCKSIGRECRHFYGNANHFKDKNFNHGVLKAPLFDLTFLHEKKILVQCVIYNTTDKQSDWIFSMKNNYR